MKPRVSVRHRTDRPYLQLVCTDPLTGKRKTRSAHTTRRDRAEREAAKWEAELAANYQPNQGVHWSGFRYRFAREHLANLRKNTRDSYFHALNKFEKLIGQPRDIAAITSSTLSQYQAKLAKENLSPETVRHLVRHLCSALGWAAKMGMIPAAPKSILPPRGGSRGRPMKWVEVAQFLSALRRIAPESHWPQLATLVKSMWLGGLRLNEALAARFDGGPVHIDMQREYPAIHWEAAGQKSRRAETVPITPDFTRMLRRMNSTVLFDSPLSRRQVAKYLTEAGRAAKILVWTRGKKTKHASAHDFRRSFGHRWALRVHPIVLKTLMRHDSLDTTMRYYVDIEADSVASQVWAAVHANVHKPVPKP